MAIEASLVGDWAETYPAHGHLALILPLSFEGQGAIKDLRLRVEGISGPLAWSGCWHDGIALPRPPSMAAPVVARCIFQGTGQHSADYHITLEGKSGWTWQTWGEFDLRPGVARYVMRLDRVKQRT